MMPKKQNNLQRQYGPSSRKALKYYNMIKNDTYNLSQCQSDLEKQGFCIDYIHLPDELKKLVISKNYPAIDEYIWSAIAQDGIIYEKMSQYTQFSEIEFIISLREEDNEDGIWHDDGSRVLAFSLSLTIDIPEKGGVLEFRKKGEKESFKISTPKYGEIIIFKTGVDHYEHKINKVEKGSRLVIAGWCYR